MKLNRNRVAKLHSYFEDGNNFEYGFYNGGRAFVAMNGEVLTKDEAVVKTGHDVAMWKDFSLTDLVGSLISEHNK